MRRVIQLFGLLFIFIILTRCSSRPEKDVDIDIESLTLGVKIGVSIRETGTSRDKPIIYITDGEEFLNQGIDLYLEQLTKTSSIPEAYYIYISSIDMLTDQNKRNTFFFCNPDYLKFFEQELMNVVETEVGRTFTREKRGLVGVSFGALNAAYFAAKAETIQNFALLSPITYPCTDLNQAIAFSKNEVLHIFISTGTHDAEKYMPALLGMFESKKYNVKELTTSGGHDFENWKGQIGEAINFMFD